MIGANDVTHHVPQRESVSELAMRVVRLRDAGCEVVVGTCPDLGTVEPIQHPLRWLARRWSRQLAAAQTIAVVEAGGRSVSLGRHPRSRVCGPALGDVRSGPLSPVCGGICRCCKRFAACRLHRCRPARASQPATVECGRGIRPSGGPGRGRGGRHGRHGGRGAGACPTALGQTAVPIGLTRTMGPASRRRRRSGRPATASSVNRAIRAMRTHLVERPPHSRMSSRRVACQTATRRR